MLLIDSPPCHVGAKVLLYIAAWKTESPLPFVPNAARQAAGLFGVRTVICKLPDVYLAIGAHLSKENEGSCLARRRVHKQRLWHAGKAWQGMARHGSGEGAESGFLAPHLLRQY